MILLLVAVDRADTEVNCSGRQLLFACMVNEYLVDSRGRETGTCECITTVPVSLIKIDQLMSVDSMGYANVGTSASRPT